MEEDSTKVPAHVTVLMATVELVVKVSYKLVHHQDCGQVILCFPVAKPLVTTLNGCVEQST